MSNLQDYMDTPYILTEEELRSKPLGDILDLTKHIDKVTHEAAHNLKIHVENVRMLNKVMNKPEKSPQNQTAH